MDNKKTDRIPNRETESTTECHNKPTACFLLFKTFLFSAVLICPGTAVWVIHKGLWHQANIRAKEINVHPDDEKLLIPLSKV